jgi:predicted Zn-dependent protease
MAQEGELLQNAASVSCSSADGPQSDQERDMDRAAALETLHQSLPWQGKQLNDYIARLGKRLASVSGTRQLFRFQVLYSSEVNAQSIPGGYIFLNTGAITAAHDEAELAAVLGHEIAHFNVSHRKCQTKESLAYRLSRAMGLAPGSWLASPSGKSGSRLTQARLRRDEEEEADRLAVIYLAKPGYDPRAAARMFGHLEELEAKGGTNGDGRLSSHPPPSERRLQAERIAASLAAFQPVIADTPEFEAARAEVLRYDAVYEAVAGESVSRPPRQPPKLIRRTGSGL